MDAIVQLGHHAGGEALVHQTAVAGMERGVHVQHHQLLLGQHLFFELPDEGGLVVRREVLVVAIDGHTLVVGGDRPKTRTVGFLVPPHRGVVPQKGEPLVGYAVDEIFRVGQVDVAEIDSGFRHVGRSSYKSDIVSEGSDAMSDERGCQRGRGLGGPDRAGQSQSIRPSMTTSGFSVTTKSRWSRSRKLARSAITSGKSSSAIWAWYSAIDRKS